MRKTLLLIVMTTAPGWSFCQQDAHAGTLRIVHSIDFPVENGFGTGLAWDGQYLWSTVYWGGPPISQGQVFRLDPSDGSVVHEFLTGGMGTYYGSAWDGDNLWIGTNYGNQEYGSPPDSWDDFLLRTDPLSVPAGDDAAGTIGFVGPIPITDFFSAPHSPDAALRGVAWDGSYLWVSDSKHREITQVDPADRSVIRSFPSPGIDPRGLTWDGSSLWIVDAADNVIHQVDTFGNLLETWSAPGTGSQPYGITFDGEYLWLVQNERDRDSLYQLAIPEPSSVGLLIPGALALLLLAWQTSKRGS